jgi:capsular polysaccharide transport system permease protein
MIVDDEEKAGSSALAQARAMSQALAEAARRARFSTRSRRALSSGGFHARSGAQAMRVFGWLTFLLIVAAPTVAAAIYYGFIASDQYVTESEFTVMGGFIPAPDSIASMTGIPAAAIVQDTQIVTNYIESRAAVEKLDEALNLRGIYSRDDIDFWARFNPKKPIEKLVSYWKDMTEPSIIMPGGIVRFRVRAFTSEDAQRLGEKVITISEELINDLNQRMLADSVKNAEQELDRTADRLGAARSALEKARNDEGVLDAEKSAEALNKLLTELRVLLAKMQQEYEAQLHAVSEEAPQMLTLKARIEAAQGQIAVLEAKLTSTHLVSPEGQPLSNFMTKFAELDLERQIAEHLYAGAATSLEIARLAAEHKMMYLNTFVRPVAPQEARYPRRILDSLGVALGALGAWGILLGGAALVRNHMA